MVFTALFDSDDFLICLLVFLKQFDILSGFVHILIQINVWHISALPDIDRHIWMGLDNEDAARVQLLTSVTLVEVFHQEPARDLVRVLRLVRTDQEDARENWDAIHGGRVETLVELDQLCDEGHVWVGDLTSLTDVLQALVKGDLLSVDHVAEAHGG